LLFFVPYYVYYKDWKDTEYMVTNQRVFFETLSGYAVVNLSDVRDVYVKRGLRDRFFGTGRVFVCYRDLQATTKFWKPHGTVIVYHKLLPLGLLKKATEFKTLFKKLQITQRWLVKA
jgi:hypothetical protein